MLDKSDKKMRFEDLHCTDQSWADVWITTLCILLVRPVVLDKYEYTVTIFSLRHRNKYSSRVQICMLYYELLKLKTTLHYIQVFRPYLAVNTFHLGYKNPSINVI